MDDIVLGETHEVVSIIKRKLGWVDTSPLFTSELAEVLRGIQLLEGWELSSTIDSRLLERFKLGDCNS